MKTLTVILAALLTGCTPCDCSKERERAERAEKMLEELQNAVISDGPTTTPKPQ